MYTNVTSNKENKVDVEDSSLEPFKVFEDVLKSVGVFVMNFNYWYLVL